MKNFKKTGLTIFLLIFFLFTINIISGMTLSVQSAYISNNFNINYSFDLNEEATYNILSTYNLEIDKRVNWGSFYINPVITYDYNRDELESELDEIYLDIYTEDSDIRIGKQMINWGKADGLVITDIINPQDLTQYPVIEYKDSFRSIESVKISHFQGMESLDIVWIPEFKTVKTEDNFMRNTILQQTDLKNPDIKFIKPDTTLDNTEIAIRYSAIKRNLDYEIIAGYIWDNHPALHIDPQKNEITAKYHRLLVGGGSFSTDYGPFVFRGEGLYTQGKKYNIKNFQEYQDGLIEKDNFKWMLGFDYTYEDYLFNFQFYQEQVLNYKEDIEQGKYNNLITLSGQRQFLRDTLASQINILYDLNENSTRIRPKIEYDYNNNINFAAGGDYSINEDEELTPGIQNDIIYFQTEFIF